VPGLGASLGRGGATTSQQDLALADCIVIEGSNMAECHPVGFQWVMEAKTRGAKIIHVDPRFTRTSAVSDTHVPIRAGTDIAFLGGLINYALANGGYFHDYVVAYTNAPVILREDFVDTEDLGGLFSGYDEEHRSYDPTTWQYEGQVVAPAAGARKEHPDDAEGSGEVQTDPTLQHPRCVFQVLKRHYARYTPEMVEEVCGIPAEQLRTVAETVCASSGRDKTTAWVYSVGWTHHSVGVQYIRTAAIMQLLLGNIGRPGGGILALRGHASIQGSTDIPTLFNLLPGYLPMPTAGKDDDGRAAYVANLSSPGKKGFWDGTSAYLTSLLKAWFGDAATAENDYGFGWLPRINGNHGSYQTAIDMADGKVDGFFVVGENPAVGHANSKLNRLAMSKAKWLVVRDFQLIESATFWKSGPEIETGEMRTEDIGTEVFFFPAAAHTEKDGTFTQTQRLLQWHHKAVEPRGDARSELQFYHQLGRIIKERLAGSTRERDRAIRNLTWDYPMVGAGSHAEPDAEAVLREVNGVDLTTGKPLGSYTEMKDDGTTTGGCWIYTGVFEDGVNHAKKRVAAQPGDWLGRDWGWAWPANRRVLYNRASADPAGKPWSQAKALVWWDAEAGRWTGHDVPDFEVTKDPSYRPPAGASGREALRGDDAFIMQGDGKGWLFAPSGVIDGPLPTHYEPHESPVRNPLYPQQANPAREVWEKSTNPSNPSPPERRAEVFPHVFTTYRLTEHHTAGGMSRWLPFLSELQPAFFIEVSPELAREQSLEHLGWATVVTARSAIEARVLVTERMVPLRSGGGVVHQIGIPYHWGVGGDGALTEGDSANDLFGITLDPNVHIQESKVSSCAVVPGRRPRGPALVDFVEGFRQRAGITTATGNAAVTVPAEEGPGVGVSSGSMTKEGS